MDLSPTFELGNSPPLPLAYRRTVLRCAALVGMTSPPPIGPRVTGSADLTDPDLLPSSRLASPLPLSDIEPLSRPSRVPAPLVRSAWFLLAVISIGRPIAMPIYQVYWFLVFPLVPLPRRCFASVTNTSQHLLT